MGIRWGMTGLLLSGAALAVVLTPQSASAVDGVIEINQARAKAGGVTPSDAPEFPVTIDSPGSYVLTSSLVLTDADTDGIQITSESVTLDMNGFGIIGPVECTPAGGPVTSCLPEGGGIGIQSTESAVHIKDGFVRGVGDIGIDFLFAGGAGLTRVAVTHSGGVGIRMNVTALIMDSAASLNGGDGISTLGGAFIKNSVATANGEDGMDVGGGSRIEDCLTASNGEVGFEVDGFSLVRNNLANVNGTGGFTIGDSSTVVGNHAGANSGPGIDFGTTGTASAWSGNSLQGNVGSDVTGTARVTMGTNVCTGSTTCP